MTYGARAIAAARDHVTTGKSVKDITAETGLLQGAVSNGMMVLRFTPELVDLVCAGAMSLGEARQHAHDVKSSQRGNPPPTPRKRTNRRHHAAATPDDRRLTWIAEHWARLAADNRSEGHYDVGHCANCNREMQRREVKQVMGADDMAGWQCLMCGGEIDPTWTPF